jgi:hypothetical protein
LVRLGVACLARWEGGEARYAHRDHWLPGQGWKPPATADALAELARRFFACYGPAGVGDFAYWLGITRTAAKPALEILRDEIVEVQTTAEGQRKLLAMAADLAELNDTPPEPEAWPARMLGRFDPLLLAHREKDWAVAAAYYNRVWRPAGHIEGVVLDQGRAVATWRYDRVPSGKLNVRVFPFRARLPVRVSKAVRRPVRSLAGFFGAKVGDVAVARVDPEAG